MDGRNSHRRRIACLNVEYFNTHFISDGTGGEMKQMTRGRGRGFLPGLAELFSFNYPSRQRRDGWRTLGIGWQNVSA